MTNEPVTVNDWRLAVIRDHLAALPEGHPGRITREMGAALAWCVGAVEDDWHGSHGLIGDAATHVPVALAALRALHSLLPPPPDARPGESGGGRGDNNG